MENKLLEVIKQNLPETTAGEMKKFIEQADKTKIDLEKAGSKIEELELKINLHEKDINSKDEFIAGKENEISELKEQINKCEDCERRHMKLGLSEELVNARINNAESRVNDAKEYLGLAFRSPVFKKSVVFYS